jgi:hypothetical protein
VIARTSYLSSFTIPSTSLVLSDSSPVIFAYRWNRDDAYQSNQGYQQRSNASAPAIAAPRQPLLFTAPNAAPNTNSRNANASNSSSRPVNRPYQPLRQAGPLGQQAYQTTVTDENNLKKTAGATTLTTSVPTMGTQLIQTQWTLFFSLHTTPSRLSNSRKNISIPTKTTQMTLFSHYSYTVRQASLENVMDVATASYPRKSFANTVNPAPRSSRPYHWPLQYPKRTNC